MTTHTNTVHAVLALGLVLLASCAEQGSHPISVTTSPEPRAVTVTGEAEVRVVPDEVRVTAGVETTDSVLLNAKNRNEETVKRVRVAAAAAGVDNKNIQTEYIDIEPRYRDSYDRKEVTNYVVRRSMVVTVRELSKFESILAAVVEAGSNYILGIEFRTTELRKYRDQARLLAVKAAREKATALASELGQQIDRPHVIEEQQDNWFSPFRSWWGGSYAGSQNVIQNAGPSSSGSAREALAPGQISVSARIKVSFELK